MLEFDWAVIWKSVVVAAAVTGVVGVLAAVISACTALAINKDKLRLDRELAKERAAADLHLAERRVALEKELALAKRRAEVAENVLATFYRMKRAFEAIRSPMIWANEMQLEDGVAEDIIRNDGYGVIRRMRDYTGLFSDLEATRFTFGALFGHDATGPYNEMIKAHNRVIHAAESLLRYRNEQDARHLQPFLQQMRREAFAMSALDDEGHEIPDPIAAAVDNAIAEIEATCRPALESREAAEAVGRRN